MLQGGGGHSAILSTFIKLPFVIKIFVLTIFEWQVYSGFTVFVDIQDSSADTQILLLRVLFVKQTV